MNIFSKISSMWKEARGDVMYHELEDLLLRADSYLQSQTHVHPGISFETLTAALLINIHQLQDHMVNIYMSSSESDQKKLLKRWRATARNFWESGSFYPAVAIGIIALNVEGRTVPGKQAALVYNETIRLMQQARSFYESIPVDERPPLMK